MAKLKLHTPDLTAQNVEKLAALFPNCVTEARDDNGKLKRGIDFDQLRQELSDHVVEGPRERYHLDWPGKREALLAANAPIAKTLRPCREESVDFDTTKNLFIEGDNLDALKLLQETYLGKVKVIYIDPPYNTGNDFIYNDDFATDSKTYNVKSGKTDEEGRVLLDEQRWQQNSSANGRFHSEWISMMYSRLKLSDKLLTDDGVILISNDDNENHNLRKICDEIFGGDNFVGQFIWDGGRKNDSRLISSSHDYITVYAKSILHLLDNGVRWREKKQGLEAIYQQAEELLSHHGTDYNAASKALQKWYSKLSVDDVSRENAHYKLIDAGGVWYGDNLSSPNYRENLIYDYKGYKPPNNGWRYDKASMERLDKEGLLYFPEDRSQRIQFKRYLKNTEFQTPKSVFYIDRRAASKELEALMEAEVFDFPKSTKLLRRLLATVDSKNSIVVDFFSGSGTTAHSVMQLNAEDEGKRRFVLVQLPEPCAATSTAYKAGYRTIADISKERIRRAGAKIKADPATTVPNLDIGFRVLKIDTSNMKDVYYAPDEMKQDELAIHTDNIKEDRTPEDSLFQVLVDWGVDLALPIAQETIAKKKVFFVDGNALAACFDPKITEDLVKELAKRKPLRAVFRDSSYGSDSVKINVEQIFKLLSPGTELKSL